MSTPLAFPCAWTRPIEPVGSLIAIPPMRTEPVARPPGFGRNDAEAFYACLMKEDGERKPVRSNRPGKRLRLGRMDHASGDPLLLSVG